MSMRHNSGSWRSLTRAGLVGCLSFAIGCQNNENPILELTVDGLWEEIGSLEFFRTLKGVDAKMADQEKVSGGTSVFYRIAIDPESVTLDPGERATLNVLVEAQGADECILASGPGAVEVTRGEVIPLTVHLVRESQKLCRVTVTKTGVATGVITSDVVAGSKGINCGLTATTCSERFPAGQPVVLRAAAGPTAHLGGWSGPDACNGRRSDCPIPALTGPVSVTEQFDVGVCTTPLFCWESPLPQGNTLRAVSGITKAPPDDVAWAVGALGTILERKDGGWYGFWAGGNQMPITQLLYGVSPGSTAAEAWAVGAAGTLLHWDGTSWGSHPKSGVATVQGLYGIAGIAPGQAWAVGLQATILQCDVNTCTPVSANDGAPGRTLQRVVSFGPKDAWAAGGAGVVQRYDSGGTWTPQTVPPAAMPPNLASIWGRDSSMLWAVGQGSVILRYTGSSWVQQNKPDLGTAGLLGVWGADVQRLWAVGNGGLVAHTENGTDWAPIPLPQYSLTAFYDIWGRSADEVVIVGQDGLILRSQGTSFAPEAASFLPTSSNSVDLAPHSSVFAVSGASAKAIWAVGQSGLILYWDGNRWQREDNPDPELRDLLAVSATATDVWAVGKAGVALHRLVNASTGWELLELPQRDSMNAIAQNSAGAVAVGALGKIWRRPGGLSMWQDLSFRTEAWYAAFGRGDELWIGGDPGGINMRTIWRADTPVGMGWTPQVTPGTSPVRALWGGNDGGMWAAGDGMIMRLDSGMSGWTTSLSMAGTTFLALGGNDTEVWASGNGGLIQQWKGTTWMPVLSGTSNNLRGLWSSRPGELVVVGVGGTVLRYMPPAM